MTIVILNIVLAAIVVTAVLTLLGRSIRDQSRYS
jgi:hypothetical protein